MTDPVIIKHANNMTSTLYYGVDCRSVVKRLGGESVHAVVTSPPYFGLRDYDAEGQIGLQETPEEYISALVDVFRETRRVLRKDGTLWLNLGDGYWGGKGASNYAFQSRRESVTLHGKQHNIKSEIGDIRPQDRKHSTLKSKDLIGMPWRVALALQADGWYLRQDIIWAKPNPTPESVRDRCTKSHEYLFMLSRSPKYHFDAEALKEPGQGGGLRNKRSVWTVATKPYRQAHFATFPQELILPCVLAGCPLDGVVLDPFSGTATTGDVAFSNGRNYVGIDINPNYLSLAVARLSPPPAFIFGDA